MRKKELQALKALYGDAKPPEPTKKRGPIHNTTPSEDDEQAVVVAWLQKKYILHFAVPNGGSRNRLEAFKLKRTGTVAGVPDLVIPLARKGYHGLFLELKRQRGGVLTDAQKYWLEQLNREGYLAKVAKGAKEAIKIIESYMHD